MSMGRRWTETAYDARGIRFRSTIVRSSPGGTVIVVVASGAWRPRSRTCPIGAAAASPAHNVPAETSEA